MTLGTLGLSWRVLFLNMASLPVIFDLGSSFLLFFFLSLFLSTDNYFFFTIVLLCYIEDDPDLSSH
jgi:hypothetical protein